MAIEAALRAFAQQVTDNFAVAVPAQPEDQLKPPMNIFLQAAGTALEKHVASRTEARVEGLGGRPDIGVAVDGLLCGHIELKAPGLGADPSRLRGDQNKKQWKKFQSLPNLIYTDGNEWALYRDGERVGTLVSLDGDVTQDGQACASDDAVARLQRILTDFFNWNPIVPSAPRELAKFLAPMTLLLRTDVEAALEDNASALSVLRNAWQQYLFPDVDDHKFADAYAQTLTYALLLARLNGAEDLSPEGAARALNAGSGLLGDILNILSHPDAREELATGLSLLERSLSGLDPDEIRRRNPDPWLYFYEDFLAAYDRKLRNDFGVYYTPIEVVRCQVRIASELLKDRFGKRLGFADDGVTFIDPAVGTGTYLLTAVQHALQLVRDRSGEGAVADHASHIARNMFGLEYLVGPYAVAHLRLTQELESEGGVLEDGRVKVYLADTLASPYAVPPYALDLDSRKMVDEHNKARELKETTNVLVCMGNPPYDREQKEEGDDARRKGGWVRYGDDGQGEVPIFDAFLQPARDAGYGGHLKNVYNDYVYFWRWALWKMFENQDGGGVVTFITASSYLAGPGFVGMREVMRRTFDELWIVNLEGDSLGARKTENIFNITTPVAIAIGVRRNDSDTNTPANVHYTKVTGTRPEKLAQLDAIEMLSHFEWQDCSEEWQATFLPRGTGDFFCWPLLTSLFPWQHSGVQYKRNWPIGQTSEQLSKRWETLMAADNEADMGAIFRETGARKVTKPYRSHLNGTELAPLWNEREGGQAPEIIRYGFRSFDRSFAFNDARMSDRMRPDLWTAHSDHQVYMATLIKVQIGVGPSAVASAAVPDMNAFNNRACMVVPLWRNADATEPNVTVGLSEPLSAAFGEQVPAEDLFAYVYAVMTNPGYVERFWEELSTPGPRIPLTKDIGLFHRAVELGRRLVWLHTYGERFVPEGETAEVPQGAARCIHSVGGEPADYPEDFSYDPIENKIIVGRGEFGPASEDVWEFEVSGLKIVQSWMSYRRKAGYGRKSSPLDGIRPERWTPRMSNEFLELLWVLEHTVAMRADLNQLLDDIVAGDCFAKEELPTPGDEERAPPRTAPPEDDAGQMGLNV